jgi:flagellar hook-associated protein 3
MVSRVTDRTLITSFTFAVSRLRRQQAEAQDALSSQKRLREASDDPVGAARSTSLRGEAKELDAYKDSVGLATTTLGAEDGVLGEAHDILIRAREIAASLTGGLATPEARQTAAEEVTELERGMLSLANTKVAGRYVFGGLTTTGPIFASFDDPGFTPATAYSGPAAPFSVQTARDESIRVTTNGGDVFTSSLQAIDDLRQTLVAGNSPTSESHAARGRRRGHPPGACQRRRTAGTAADTRSRDRQCHLLLEDDARGRRGRRPHRHHHAARAAPKRARSDTDRGHHADADVDPRLPPTVGT